MSIENLELTAPLVEGKERIVKYLPQRNPFVMVESLWLNNETTTVTSLKIEDSNCLTENGLFTESGLLENMAQTAATRVGYGFIEAGLDVPVGFITAIKDFKVLAYPKVGDQIYTEAEHVNDVMNFSIVKGRIYVGKQLMAEAEVRVFINK
ncbi:MAG: hydroxymyristoyl-ACP dehydratase [Cytophagaceae bacterium]|jgi:3-hydroxymyristoyl/3-hydroxydecanoyl-(acyl carrier protein) dehydratase|nr:hydroxymyristoyl-ACP dehydratase [Cytophagaceae bacterium]